MFLINFLLLGISATQSVLLWFGDPHSLSPRISSQFKVFQQKYKCMIGFATWSNIAPLRTQQHTALALKLLPPNDSNFYNLRIFLDKMQHQPFWHDDGNPKNSFLRKTAISPNNMVSGLEAFGDRIYQANYEEKTKMKQSLIRRLLLMIAKERGFATDFMLAQNIPILIVDDDDDALDEIRSELKDRFFVDIHTFTRFTDDILPQGLDQIIQSPPTISPIVTLDCSKRQMRRSSSDMGRVGSEIVRGGRRRSTGDAMALTTTGFGHRRNSFSGVANADGKKDDILKRSTGDVLAQTTTGFGHQRNSFSGVANAVVNGKEDDILKMRPARRRSETNMF